MGLGKRAEPSILSGYLVLHGCVIVRALIFNPFRLQCNSSHVYSLILLNFPTCRWQDFQECIQISQWYRCRRRRRRERRRLRVQKVTPSHLSSLSLGGDLCRVWLNRTQGYSIGLRKWLQVIIKRHGSQIKFLRNVPILPFHFTGIYVRGGRPGESQSWMKVVKLVIANEFNYWKSTQLRNEEICESVGSGRTYGKQSV